MFQQNASKFVILLEYKNQRSFFHYVDIEQVIHITERNKVAQNEKQKSTWVFVFQNYDNF